MPQKDDDDGSMEAKSVDGLLSLRQIEVFHTVMQARSITGASKVLNVSQPALSRTIRRIEDILGIALFVRDRNGLVPTSEALEIHAEIDPLMRQLTGVGTQIGRIARGETAIFRTGSTASVARALVPQALRALSVEVPGIELFFDVLPVDQIEDYLIAGRGEAVVTIATSEHPLIAAEVVGNADLVACIPKNHHLAEQTIIKASDLEGADFVAFAAGGAHQKVVGSFLSRAGVKVNTRAVARFSDTALALANEQMGIVLVDYLTTLGPIGSNLVIRPLENAPRFQISVLWNRRRPHSANLRKLIEILSRKLALPQAAL
ncbi:LysR family transcriptional regulator [Xaviernesmea oryzae]|uniref:DNA-binding transcriptional regulator, LysR family n=1 Tax=Xaviernesmea oryzae TaxID=464029 RepID=A0A1X7DIK1_9HYPH|nr:LysR family transcriptional regulator [Xaviernesmea oryzae]SMF16205.1 DNA-binding transcriptional regulator, LysR family [Xaviernesmea oryzae]